MWNKLISLLKRSQSYKAGILFPPLVREIRKDSKFFPLRIFKSGTVTEPLWHVFVGKNMA